MREIVKKFSTLPKKSVVLAGVGIVGFVIIIAVIMFPSGKKEQLELRKSIFEFEYGEEPTLLIGDILKNSDKDILDQATISMSFESETTADGTKRVVSVGTYTQKVRYKKETKEFKVKIQDTIAPKFIDFKETIEVEQGTTEDLNTKFNAEDLSEVTIKVDTEKVDLTKNGEYKTTVTATDAHKNKTVKDVVIVVKEKADESQEAETDTNADSQSTTGSGTDNSNGTGGNSTGGGSSTNNTGGATTNSQQTNELCPGGYNPSLPCGAIVDDGDMFGQSHKIFNTYAEVEAVINAYVNFRFDEAKALCGEDLSGYTGNIVGATIYYNDGSKKYSFRIY